MKRNLCLSIMICFSLLFAGCSAGSASTVSAAVGGISVPGVSAAGDGQYILALQLALGTLKLEQTEYPVDAEQAASLLPLWKAARSLGNNDTASDQEMNALVDQIKGSMTSEQWKTIQSMGSSTEELMAITQELNLQTSSIGPTGSFPSTSNTSTGQSGSAPTGGDMPANPSDGGVAVEGGGPMEGGAPPDAGVPASSGTGAQVSQNDSGSSFMGLSESLLDAVIEYLEAKI